MSIAPRAARAVVFAYHDVGVRCLRTLLAGGVDVPLVITHTSWPAPAKKKARSDSIWLVAEKSGWK